MNPVTVPKIENAPEGKMVTGYTDEEREKMLVRWYAGLVRKRKNKELCPTCGQKVSV